MATLGRLAQTVLDYATSIAKRNWAPIVEPIHLLAAIRRWDEEEFDEKFPSLGEKIERALLVGKGTSLKPESVEGRVLKLLEEVSSSEELDEIVSQLMADLKDVLNIDSNDVRGAAERQSNRQSSSVQNEGGVADAAFDRAVNQRNILLDSTLIGRISGLLGIKEEELLPLVFGDVDEIRQRVLSSESLELAEAVSNGLGVSEVLPDSGSTEFLTLVRMLVDSTSPEAGRLGTLLAIAYVDLAEFAASLDSVVTDVEIDAIDSIRLDCREALGGRLDATSEALLQFESKFAELVGMHEVKKDLKKRVEFMLVHKRRASRGLPVEDHRMHMAFVGNPGTGKTTVARLYGQLLDGLGLLPSNLFHETDRSGLIGSFVGETEKKTREVIRKAEGGILFIDEAYALNDEFHSGKGYGEEAVNVLVKQMEDCKDRLMVVFAGYKEPMESFLTVNPGLKSRIPSVIEFPDYSVEELLDIVQRVALRRGLTLSSEAMQLLSSSFHILKEQDGFGNAREVENLLDSAQRNLTARVSHMGNLATTKEMSLIIKEDIPEVSQVNRENTRGPIGFRS